jgi:hypothetical protein
MARPRRSEQALEIDVKRARCDRLETVSPARFLAID